jgi:hypothetical protein
VVIVVHNKKAVDYDNVGVIIYIYMIIMPGLSYECLIVIMVIISVDYDSL